MYSILFSTRPWESNPNLTLIRTLCKRAIPKSINFGEGANHSPKGTNHRSRDTNFFEGGWTELILDLRELIPVLTLTRCGFHVEYFKEFGANLDNL